MKKLNIFISLAFIALISLPILDNIFNFSPVRELFEKRLPVKAPKIPKNIKEIKKFPKNFENFYNDNYGFRKTLITANSWVLDSVFNQSPSERAFIGKEDWLYFDNRNSILDAQGLAKISDQEVENAANSFIKNWQKLKAQNIKYLLVIAADKSSIYPEFLPGYIKYSNKNRRIDKFLTFLKKKSPNFPVLDLRPVLKSAKKNEIIYHKTDTHWNRRGAHYGYASIMQKLGLKYNSRAKFTNKQDSFYKGDISNIMNINAKNIDYDLKEKFKISYKEIILSQKIKNQFHHPSFFYNKNAKLSIFVYKDSFFDNMLYFFAENFNKSYFVNEFPCDLDMKIIKKYQPDVLIQQFWEARIEEVASKCK